MAITGFCYYIDSCMTQDMGDAIRVHRVGLSDDGSITTPQSQVVPISANVAYGQRMIGASVQPTPSALILIGGETDDAQSIPPLAYATRDANTGAITSNFIKIQHSIEGSLAWCSHFYHVAQDSTKSIYMIGSSSILKGPSFNIYRILLDSNGIPSSVVYCGNTPGDRRKNRNGLLSFIQDNKLWVFLREQNGLKAYWTNVNASGAITDSSVWNKSYHFEDSSYGYRLRNGKSYAFSQNGGRFYIPVENYYGELCAVAEIIGGDIDAWSVGRSYDSGPPSLGTGLLIRNENKFYALKEYNRSWWWFSANEPGIGPYPDLSFTTLHDTQSGHYYRDVGDIRYFTFMSGGVTYTTPSNTRPNTKPTLTFDWIDNLINNRAYGEGDVSGASLVVARTSWGYFSADNLQVGSGRWNYLNNDLKPGENQILVRAYNTHNNFSEVRFTTYIAKQPPSISIYIPSYKSQSYYIYLSDEYAGLRQVDYAITDTFPSSPNYTNMVFNPKQSGGVFKSARLSLISGSPINQKYLYVRAVNSIGMKTERVFPLNSSAQGSLDPPYFYSTITGICKQEWGKDIDGSDFAKVDIWWKYPPPEGSQYAQFEGDFVRYDFDKNSFFAGGKSTVT
ncbi:MAG: hypothetical protein QXX57_00320 [Nitrososphaerota archaeon]